MRKSIYGMIVIVATVASLSGCNSVTNKLAESDPAPSKVTKRETLIERDNPKSDNCELKRPGGGGQCEDGRHALAKNSTASKNKDRDFVPSDCTAFGLRGYKLLAELGHRMSEWKAYCSASGSGATSNASASGQQTPAGGDGSKGGTWFCEDSVDGSGNYGTFEMTLQTGRFYDCRKVN